MLYFIKKIFSYCFFLALVEPVANLSIELNEPEKMVQTPTRSRSTRSGSLKRPAASADLYKKALSKAHYFFQPKQPIDAKALKVLGGLMLVAFSVKMLAITLVRFIAVKLCSSKKESFKSYFPFLDIVSSWDPTFIKYNEIQKRAYLASEKTKIQKNKSQKAEITLVLSVLDFLVNLFRFTGLPQRLDLDAKMKDAKDSARYRSSEEGMQTLNKFKLEKTAYQALPSVNNYWQQAIFLGKIPTSIVGPLLEDALHLWFLYQLSLFLLKQLFKFSLKDFVSIGSLNEIVWYVECVAVAISSVLFSLFHRPKTKKDKNNSPIKLDAYTDMVFIVIASPFFGPLAIFRQYGWWVALLWHMTHNLLEFTTADLVAYLCRPTEKT